METERQTSEKKSDVKIIILRSLESIKSVIGMKSASKQDSAKETPQKT